LLPCYLVTLLPCYLVTLLPCYLVALLSWQFATLCNICLCVDSSKTLVIIQPTGFNTSSFITDAAENRLACMSQSKLFCIGEYLQIRQVSFPAIIICPVTSNYTTMNLTLGQNYKSFGYKLL
jgi:hypothetical protein